MTTNQNLDDEVVHIMDDVYVRKPIISPKIFDLRIRLTSIDNILENLSVNSPDRTKVLKLLYETKREYYNLTGECYKLRDDGR